MPDEDERRRNGRRGGGGNLLVDLLLFFLVGESDGLFNRLSELLQGVARRIRRRPGD
jgi:hypothetical protein